MIRKSSLVAFAVVAGSLVACSSSDDGRISGYADEEGNIMPLRDRASTTTQWTYAGGEGPSHWASISPRNAACGGEAQSPVPLSSGTARALNRSASTLALEWGASRLALRNTTHSVQVDYQPGSFMMLDGERYALEQFHFHAHSEHTVDGVAYPLEVHFVHRSEKGALAVVAVFVDEGSEANEALDPVLEHIGAAASSATFAPGTTEAFRLLPSEGRRSFFRYDGSLTTPPCTEGVRWVVIREPAKASAAQLVEFSTLLNGNYRPLQPLNGRTVAMVK